MVKMYTRLPGLFLLLFLANLSSGQGIDFFHGTWEEAKAKAKETGKLVFVDAYTSWCGPCKRMAATIFPLQEVGTYYNANFINYKLDMEKGEGPSFAQKYGVRAYPTFVFVDGDGNMIFNRVGGSDAPGFIQMGKTAVERYDRSPQLAKKYEEGDHSPELVLDYIKALNAAGKSSLKVANEYLASGKNTKSDLYYRIIFESAVSSDSKPYGLLLSNEKAISGIVGRQAYDQKVYQGLVNAAEKGIGYETEELVTESLNMAKKVLDKDNYKVYVSHVELLKADAANDGKKYIAAAAGLNKNLNAGSPVNLEQIIRILQSKYSNLEESRSLIGVLYHKLAENTDDPGKRLEYAIFLDSVKDKENALKEAKKAREDAQKKGLDTTKYDNTILKINSK